MIRVRGEASDRGETLVEVLVALIILGLAGVAVLTGLLMSVEASDIHRKETSGGAFVRNYAEAIQNWVGAHQSAFSCSPDYSAATVGFNPPTGYIATYTFSALDGTGTTEASCTDQNAAQMVEVEVKTSDARADQRLSFVLRRPCSGAQDVAATTCN